VIYVCLFLAFCTCKAFGATHYVSLAGDNSDGTTWAKAWTHPESLDTNPMSEGDTALFGQGSYYGVNLDVIDGNNGSDKTHYACSTYSLATAHTAELWGGDVVSTWTDTSVGGNTIYKAVWTPTNLATSPGDFTSPAVNSLYPCVVGDTGVDLIYNTHEAITDVNQAGYAFYNYTDTMLYIWPYSGGDPDVTGEKILATADQCVTLQTNTANYVVMFGLNIKMGWGGAMRLSEVAGAGGQSDSCLFWHCTFAHANKPSEAANTNGGVIVAENEGGSYFKWDNVFRACSIFSATGAIEREGDTGAGSGILMYGMKRTVVDSCVFKQLPGAGVMWKGGGSAYTGNRVSFCTFDGTDSMPYGRSAFKTHAYEAACGADRDSCYGNQFINIYNSRAVGIKEGDCNPPGAQYYMGDFICNNSFYNCNGFIHTHNEAPEDADSTFVFKYNVMQKVRDASSYWVYSTNAGPIHTPAYCDIDSNIWYDSSGGNNFLYREISTNRNWSYWTTTEGYDANGGDTTDAGYDGAPTDLTRSGASGEMNRTYGGRTWTIFGAVQNDGGSGPSKAPFKRSEIELDSLYSDSLYADFIRPSCSNEMNMTYEGRTWTQWFIRSKYGYDWTLDR
jgi:hypothetical protein